MIGHAAQRDEAASVPPDCVGHERVELGPELRVNPRNAVLGAEDGVKQDLRERVPHGGPPLSRSGGRFRPSAYKVGKTAAYRSPFFARPRPALPHRATETSPRGRFASEK